MMLKREPHVYKLAGVRKLKNYLKLARSEAIVISPHSDGWIEIDPRFYTSGQAHASEFQSIQTTSCPSISPSMLPPSLPEGAESHTTAAPVSPPQESSAQGFPEPFISLYWLLRHHSPSSGRVLFSLLGSSICEHDPNLYKREGVSGLTPYLEQARSIGIVTLGRTQGMEWVQWVGPHPAL